jgi:hypothetical protein
MYAYATLWFTSSFFLASIGVSCVHIFVGRGWRQFVCSDRHRRRVVAGAKGSQRESDCGASV